MVAADVSRGSVACGFVYIMDILEREKTAQLSAWNTYTALPVFWSNSSPKM